MIKRFWGLNIAVGDLDAAAKKYSEVFGLKPTPLEGEDFAFPGLKGVRFLVGDVVINLIASEQPDTSIAKFVQTRGEGIFLISFEVTDIEKDVEELAKKGIRFATEKPLPFPGGLAAWGHPKSLHGVQVELLQLKPGWPPKE